VRVRPRPSILGWLRSRSIAAAVVCHSGSRAFSQNQRLRSNIFLSLLCALSVRRQFVLCLCVCEDSWQTEQVRRTCQTSLTLPPFFHTHSISAVPLISMRLFSVFVSSGSYFGPRQTPRSGLLGKKTLRRFLYSKTILYEGLINFLLPHFRIKLPADELCL
jgi:hypothetical protein